MTVSSTTVPTKKWAGNDVDDTFNVPFSFDAATDLVAFRIETDESQTDLTKDAVGDDGYTITGANLVMNTIPATGEYLVVYRSTALTQLIDLVNNRAFDPNVLEGALDKLVYILQEISGQGTSLAVRAAISVDDSPNLEFTEMAAARALKYLGFDASGDLALLQNLDGVTMVDENDMGGAGASDSVAASQQSIREFVLNAVKTMTNVTLTSPVVNSPTINDPTIVLGSDATGDIWYRKNDGTVERLPAGSADQVLHISGGIPAWVTLSDYTFNADTLDSLHAVQLGSYYDYTSSGTFNVPAHVNVIYVSAGSGGGGGGGGESDAAGGGGGGGSAGITINSFPLPVAPSAAVTVTVGGGGAGGALDSPGSTGGSTVVGSITLTGGIGGGAGTVSGGAGGSVTQGNMPSPSGGAGGTGGIGTESAGDAGGNSLWYSGGAGGAPSGGQIGGGGGGAASSRGVGGAGGNASNTGTAAAANTSAGGGGGGGNLGAGGAGGSGWVRITW